MLACTRTPLIIARESSIPRTRAMIGKDISPNKRKPFPQFGGRKAAVTARELQSSFDALPEVKPVPSGQPKPEVKPAPARTIRPSAEKGPKSGLKPAPAPTITPSAEQKWGSNAAPARTVRASSEADFKLWLASLSQLQPASTNAVRPVSAKSGASPTASPRIVCTATQPRWRYESSSDQSAGDDSASVVEAESQSNVGLNAGS